MTEMSDETGNHLLFLHSNGDIVLNAPNGRVHINSKLYSKKVGAPGKAEAAGAITPAATSTPVAQKESYIAGLGSGLWNSTVTPLLEVVKHPAKAIKGIGHVVAHPWESGKAVIHAGVGTGKAILHGDGRALGMAIGTIGMMAVPGAGEAEAAEDLARISKVGEVAQGGEVASDAGKLEEAGAVTESSEAAEKTEQSAGAASKEKLPASDLPANPDDLLNQGYTETSHPNAAANGHRTFENSETGDTLRFDEGDPGQSGYAGQDHYHRENPDKTGKMDRYLDADGNPIPKGAPESHLPPKQ